LAGGGDHVVARHGLGEDQRGLVGRVRGDTEEDAVATASKKSFPVKRARFAPAEAATACSAGPDDQRVRLAVGQQLHRPADVGVGDPTASSRSSRMSALSSSRRSAASPSRPVLVVAVQHRPCVRGALQFAGQARGAVGSVRGELEDVPALGDRAADRAGCGEGDGRDLLLVDDADRADRAFVAAAHDDGAHAGIVAEVTDVAL
jgi:hypothetical protein